VKALPANGAPLVRRFRLRHLFVLVLVAGSAAAGADLSPAESKLVAGLRFDPGLMVQVKAVGTALERLEMEDGDGNLMAYAGVVLLTPPGKSAISLATVRSKLARTGYGAWINDNAFGRGPDKIAIMKTRDQYAYLAVAHTDGINWDHTHEEVVAHYRQWAGKYGLELTGAGLDWLSARFSKPPEDWLAFAREVYKFCPDIVDQGTNTVEKLADEMRASNELYLWWD
jgi:hypothetical protein